MSFRQLIQADLPKKQEEFKKVSPTLLVGLGGTGKDVLLRFRRLMVERYGSLDQFPFVQFMHLDTDSTRNAEEQYDIRAEEDPLFEGIRLSSRERIDLTVQGGTERYTSHLHKFPHIKRWYHADSKIAKLGDLGEGAGQIRMASRLALYHGANYSAISNRLGTVGGRLRDAENRDIAGDKGFELDNDQIEIVVVGSLAGGTGGGIFLDMGFLLQKFFPKAERTGIFLLPGFFSGYAGAARTRANGYAALMELNHYTFGHAFLGDWDGVNAKPLPPPVFSNTYLVSARNEADLVIDSSGKEYSAYQMVAEFLFQDFALGAFAGRKRATRVNLVNFNLDVYMHNFLSDALTSERGAAVGDFYPRRFGSFGLSRIAFPSDRVRGACACRLAHRILQGWERELLDDPLDELFSNFLTHPDISFAQGRYELRDGSKVINEMQIEDALLWYDRESGKTFPGVIWDTARSIRSDVAATAPGQKADRLRQARAQLEQNLSSEDSDHPEDWGVWVRALESNKASYLRSVLAGIRARAGRIANDPRKGVAVALSVLRELKSLLRSEIYPYLDYFEGSIESWESSTRTYSHEFDQLETDVAHHERQRLFRKMDLERDLRLLAAKDSGDDDLGVIYNYLYSRVMKQVAKRGREICLAVDEFLGKDDSSGKGLLAEYYRLLTGFEKVADRLRRKEGYFAKERKSQLTASLFRSGDVEAWYRTWLGDEKAESQALKSIGSRLLTEVFKAATVTEALEQVQRQTTEDVEEAVFTFCRDFIASKEEQPNALELLLDGDRYTAAQQEDLVRRAYDMGKVWLARAERGIDHTQLPEVQVGQKPYLIGVDDSDRQKFNDFKKLVDRIRKPGDSPVTILEIGKANAGAIVFYSELAGVPTFYPNPVTEAQGMKESYEAHEDKDELHTDKNRFKFGEVVPKTDEEAIRYADSLRAFVLGRLQGKVEVTEKKDRSSDEPVHHYFYRKPTAFGTEKVFLGKSSSTAVDNLYRQTGVPESQTDRQLLIDQVEAGLIDLRDRKLLHVWTLLIDFYRDLVYPVETDDDWAETFTVRQYPAENAVLYEAREQIEKTLLTSELERDQLREQLRGLRKQKGEEKLSYEDYALTLEPFVSPAGSFEIREVRQSASDRNVYRPAFALDFAKIDGKAEVVEVTVPAAPPRTKSEPKVPKRKCPSCGQLIDTRAVKCIHCKTEVATHKVCPNCGEQKVPSDLAQCWRCGTVMPGQEEEIRCPKCFNYSGPKSSYPCPDCGYSFDQPEEPEKPAPAPAASAAREEPAAAPAAEPEPELVECPSCFELVEAGPICPKCSTRLS